MCIYNSNGSQKNDKLTLNISIYINEIIWKTQSNIQLMKQEYMFQKTLQY